MTDPSLLLAEPGVSARRTLRALVVDDDACARHQTQGVLLRLGLEVMVAGNADDAVSLSRVEKPDIVLAGVARGRDDGFRAVRRVRALYPDRHVPAIFLCDSDDEALIQECYVHHGDIIRSPLTHAVLRVRLAAALHTRQQHETVSAQRDSLLAFHDHMRGDVHITKSILDSFTTHEALGADNVDFLLRPMETLSGDFVMAAVRPSRAQCFIVGDFTGHGLPAAIGLMVVHGVFCSMVQKGFDLASIAAEINRKINSMLPTGRFLAAALLELDPVYGILSVWNGGMPDVLVRGDDLRISASFPSMGLPLGILAPNEFVCTTRQQMLCAGDRVFAYSDGVVEATNVAGEMYGRDRLKAGLEGAEDALPHLVRDLDAFVGGRQQSDDISVLAFSYEPDSASSRTAWRRDYGRVERGATRWSLRLDFDHETLRSLEPLSAFTSVADRLQGFGSRAGEIFRLVSELFNNAVDYGLLGLQNMRQPGVPFGPDYFFERRRRLDALSSGSIHIALDHQPLARGGVLEIRVGHDGDGFDYDALLERIDKNGSDGGRGLGLVRALCESLDYSDDGRVAIATYRWANDDVPVARASA